MLGRFGACWVFWKHEIVEAFVVFAFCALFLGEPLVEARFRWEPPGLFPGMGNGYTAGMDELEPMRNCQRCPVFGRRDLGEYTVKPCLNSPT